jgi:hypothetical protein
METQQTYEQILEINQIPEAVNDFEPTMNERFLTLKDGQYQRQIFTNDELREKEEQHLEQFREYCSQNQITIPQGYDDDNRFVLRILQGKKWKYDVTAAAIIEHHDWKTATYPMAYDPVKDMLNAGVIYGFMRDKCFRPVVIVNCEKILQNAVSPPEILS